MANPTLRNAGSWVAANATTQVVTLPTHQTGDMLIVWVGMKHATLPGDITINQGFTQIDEHNNGTTASSNGGGDVEIAAFYKVATSGSETNPTVTYHASVAATPSAAVAHSFQNGGMPWETPVGDSGSVAAATSYTATMASHIAAAANDLLIGFVVTNDNTTLTVPTLSQTGLTLAAVSELPATALSSATSNDISADGCSRAVTSGTSSAAAVFSGTNSVADVGAAMVIRLRTGSYTGSGGVTIAKPTLDGTGTHSESVTGSGGATLPKPSLSGSGAEEFTGSGAVTLPKPTLSGSGTETFTGSGGVTLPKPTLDGAGIETFTGSGGAVIPKPTLAGSGEEQFTGSGAVILPAPAIAGSGAETFTGSGGVTLPKPVLDGSGTVESTVPVEGSGGIVIAKPSVSGVGIGGIVRKQGRAAGRSAATDRQAALENDLAVLLADLMR